MHEYFTQNLTNNSFHSDAKSKIHFLEEFKHLTGEFLYYIEC